MELKIGDVIKSTEFEFGYLNPRSNDEIIEVGKDVNSYTDYVILSEDQRVLLAAKTGKIPPKKELVNNFRHDRTRATAEFVVVEVSYYSSSGGGGYCHAFEITAQRLNNDGVFAANNEKIWFYTNGSISALNYINLSKITVIRTMKVSFV